jgi:hypothetical protein
MAFYQLIHDEFVTMQKFIFSYSGTSLQFFCFYSNKFLGAVMLSGPFLELQFHGWSWNWS